MNQAPVTKTLSQKMDDALDDVVSNKCWKETELTGLSFSATASTTTTTTTRRAQAVTASCADYWATVSSLWENNFTVLSNAENQFGDAMTKVNTCLSATRRLQAPTPTEDPSCAEGETALTKALNTLEEALGGKVKADSLVNSAKAVTITNDAATVTGNDGYENANSEHVNLEDLRSSCGSKK